MKCLPQDWVMDRELSLKERESVFILAESAGLKVYPDTRDNVSAEKFPFICSDSSSTIAITAARRIPHSHEIVSYEEIITILEEMVKERIV